MRAENKIAIVGLACKYPDADNPGQLWENILMRRRAFRDMPAKRLNKNYFSADPFSADQIYTSKVAVLKNYHFDRLHFKISKNNFNTADITHWLALEVANEALKDACLENLPLHVREKVGVIIGNTLTGELSRANLLRLRWPYVANSISFTLKQQNWDSAVISKLLVSIEENFKKPFPKIEEDSLAGGLSNTIAGRICNYFDFKGGGFTIDGACSSSLLAVAKACDTIINKDLLLALVGGVDISLDPFELVGFSKAGALATKEMLVYDNNSNGFWPGEGCGFVVLADYNFARKNDLKILALIKGWGISSDGKGGLTRPEINGQYLALKRAYEKAQYGIDTVTYIEGHGTGTANGDTTELSAIIKILSEKIPEKPVYIGSIKANIGHTKAAAGLAGLIKTVLILENKLIPANTGTRNPHFLFQTQHHLQLPVSTLRYEHKTPLRIGVSSMGFGGINTHITLEENADVTAVIKQKNVDILSSSFQDTELFLLAENSIQLLKNNLNLLSEKARQISLAEMADLSCTLYKKLEPNAFRAAIEAATPAELDQKISKLINAIGENDFIFENDQGIYYSNHKKNIRIGLLFPGQGNNILSPGALLTQRFPFLSLFISDILKSDFERDNLKHTHIAQPAIVETSLVAIKFLEKLEIESSVAVGHSVGEISALYWAHILSEKDSIELVKYRGKIMHESPLAKGSMISINLNHLDPMVGEITRGVKVSTACINSPAQFVLSGKKEAIEKICERCNDKAVSFTLLKVENAFHSFLMKEVEGEFRKFLGTIKFSNPDKRVFSTVSGNLIKNGKESLTNLSDQLIKPVLFYQAFCAASENVDLWIEAGAGSTLSNIVKSFSDAKTIALDFSGKTVTGIARAAGILFVCDQSVQLDLLFANRFFRPLHLDEKISFIENPCESIEEFHYEEQKNTPTVRKLDEPTITGATEIIPPDIEVLFKKDLSNKLKLPLESINNSDKMLDDFHLNSLFVGQFLSEFANAYNLKSTDTPAEYANASVHEITQMYSLLNLDGHNPNVRNDSEEKYVEPEGIYSWIHAFEMTSVEMPLQVVTQDSSSELFDCIVCGDIPERIARMIYNNPAGPHKTLVVFLYATDESRLLKPLLESVRIIKTCPDILNALFIQKEPVSNGFAKSLFHELHGIKVSVITIDKEDLGVGLLYDELTTVDDFLEVTYLDGKRFIPELMPLITNREFQNILPNRDDVILVTGGAKGITLECIRGLGRLSKSKFILIGRGDSREDKFLKRNLDSLTQSNIDFEYCQSDISDIESLSRAIETIHLKYGIITGLIHAAGINKPKRIVDIVENDIMQSLKPKVTGLQNLFSLIDIKSLKFCISFGSLIAESGMAGNADYALANQWLKNEILQLATRYPDIYFLNIEWSVWGGTGMGQNLGVLESLKKQGIDPISLDNGINFFIDILKKPPSVTNVIATGRYGKLSTLQHKQKTKNLFYRFVEDIKVYYPGIELIVDCNLSPYTDLYLQDHVFEDKMLFPAVVGMEAMVQAAVFLAKTDSESIELHNVDFLQPIIIEKNINKRIRIIAQKKEENIFSVVIRDEISQYKKDHFRATIILKKTTTKGLKMPFLGTAVTSLDTVKDLYGSVLFQRGMFERVNFYYEIEPYKCIASASNSKMNYFSDFFSQLLLLGNPGLNDAVMHAIQVCVPDRTLLPIRIGRVVFYSLLPVDVIIINATEKGFSGDDYIYDIQVASEEGIILQEWTSVVFKGIQIKGQKELPLPLIGIALQRKVDQLTKREKKFTISFNRQFKNDRIIKRTDGKPLPSDNTLTKTHSGNNSLLIEADFDISCDMEVVLQKPLSVWKTLLGRDKIELIKKIQSEIDEDFSSIATRIWCATECIRKIGLQTDSPIMFSKTDTNNTIYLESGEHKIITFKCLVKKERLPYVFTVLLKTTHEEKV